MTPLNIYGCDGLTLRLGLLDKKDGECSSSIATVPQFSSSWSLTNLAVDKWNISNIKGRSIKRKSRVKNARGGSQKSGSSRILILSPLKLQQSNTCGDPPRVTIYWMLVQPLAVDIVTSTSRFKSFMLVLTEIFTSLCDGVRFLLVRKCCKGVWVKCIDWTLVNGETSSQGEHQLADNVALFPESPHSQPDFHCIK